LISAARTGYRCLEDLIKQKANIVGVFTLEDKLTENVSGFVPFDEITALNKISLFKIAKISDTENVQRLRELKPNIIFVIGFSQLIPKEILELPSNGCIGMHPTLLPAHRGRAPIPWAIINGLKKTGSTMFYLDEDVDSGQIICQVEYVVDNDETASTLYNKMIKAFVQLMRENFPLLVQGNAPKVKQDKSKASYWAKRTPKDGLIDWNNSAYEIWTLVRATTHPYPGAFTRSNGKKLVIWSADLLEVHKGNPGKVVSSKDNGFVVGCGQGSIVVKTVQFGDESEKEAIKLIKENKINVGDVFGGD